MYIIGLKIFSTSLRNSFAIIFLLLFILNYSQGKSYFDYHNYINKAEKEYFINSNVDSSLIYYNRAFDEYDFVFLRDLLNAAQISAYSDRPIMKYILRGFEVGLTPSHINNYPLLISKINLEDKVIQKEFSQRRIMYRKSIDYTYLLRIYDIGIKDQIKKSKNRTDYNIFKKSTLNRFKQLVVANGFPSSKTIGIDCENIFSEIDKSKYDLGERKLKFSNKLNDYRTQDKLLGHTTSLYILIHNKCSFLELKDQLLQAMKNGEIHPREIGVLYDNMYRFPFRYDKSCKEPSSNQGLFYLNLFCDYIKLSAPKKASDTLRKKWWVNTQEVDEMKRKFEELHGFNMTYGFWNCL